MNVQDLIKIGSIKLEECGKEEPRFIAKKLLACLLKQDVTYLAIHSETEIEKSIEMQYMEAIEKIKQGIPLQYITNEQSFMGISFYVDENVLIPRPDTEILVEEIIEIAKKENKTKILDMCTGSGAIAVSLAKYIKEANVTAVDISKGALEVAKQNAKSANVNVEFIESDLFKSVREAFDIIVSNPPYIRTDVILNLDEEVKKEPMLALDGGITGLDFYKRIIKEAKDYLNEDGYLAVEIGYDQKEDVMEIFKQEGYKDIYSKKDFGNNDRIVVGKKVGEEMSFSVDVKQELSQLNNWINKDILKAELNGYMLSSNTNINEEKVEFVTENINNWERYKKILDNLKLECRTQRKGKLYQTIFNKSEDLTDIDVEDKEILKAVLRGAFMASGAVNNPNKEYHLEMFFTTVENAKFIKYITEQFGIKTKLLKREKNYSIYLKDGEAISNLLALIGANKAVLNFEEIRVMREMKNNVNRIVNCETANLNKIINVSVVQIEDIKYIQKMGKFDELPQNLKEIAQIRLDNPDMSLSQMGEMLENPIGKSGVNHRLKKISQIATDLRKEEI